MDVCSIIDSREAWGTQFDQANLKYVAGSDSLATDVPAFANYFYLLQCFIPGIFTIPTQVGSIALPPTTWVEANKDALLLIFGEMKLRALRKAVAQRREDFIPSKSEPTPLFLPKEKKGKAQGNVAIQQAAPALSYQVIFDLSDPAIARWKTHAQLGWHFNKIAMAWKRAKKTFIPDNILQPLHKEWTDLTGSADLSVSVLDISFTNVDTFVAHRSEIPTCGATRSGTLRSKLYTISRQFTPNLETEIRKRRDQTFQHALTRT